MRVYGRIVPDILYPYKKKWVQINTDANGFNDMVYLTNMIQVIRLNLHESPFFSNWGIPAHVSVMTQIAPDYYMNLIQQRFAKYFTLLTITNLPNRFDSDGRPAPAYQYFVVTQYGAVLTGVIPY
ncbi:MAG TPA: hypothetical protein VK890_10995 [Bacteroidia bacterium]|jgi:hypothetical protein|nr:hypothetical protein [Bacteroidia bacterium]